LGTDSITFQATKEYMFWTVCLYSANVVAAVGIANKINQLPIQIVFGFTQGVMPLIGYNYACKNYSCMKESVRKTYIITISSLLAIFTQCRLLSGKRLKTE